MLQLFAYPELFGIPDNNPFGLKVDTFLRLNKVPYQLNHILDTSDAPRGQLPYIEHNGTIITDSNRIIDYISTEYQLGNDNSLTDQQRALHSLIVSMLDNHLYWVMSYSRWQDDEFWPHFMAEFLRCFPDTPKEALLKARSYNIGKYHAQGTGRYARDEVYQSGTNDLQTLATLLGTKAYLFGDQPHNIDACCYGFLANIFYFDIDTPLKGFIEQSNLRGYVERIRSQLGY